MKFGLDILFVDETGTITAIADHCQPGSQVKYQGNAQYVLEVPAGTCLTQGIAPGQSVNFGRGSLGQESVACYCAQAAASSQSTGPLVAMAVPSPSPAPSPSPSPSPSPILPPPPALPGSPGGNGMIGVINPQAAITAGLNAYQSLLAQFPGFPGLALPSVLTPPEVSLILGTTQPNTNQESLLQEFQNYFNSNSADFQTLLKTCTSITVDQMNGFAIWLSQVSPSTTFTPAQMTALIQQQILGVPNAFPALDLPTRVYNFLCAALAVTVNEGQEQIIETQIASLQTQEFSLMEAEMDAQSNLLLAQYAALPITQVNQLQAMIGVPGTSPSCTLALYLTQATINPCQETLIEAAQNEVAQAQASVSTIRAQIAAAQAQLVAVQQTVLTNDELGSYLIANLSASPIATALTTNLLTLERNLIAGQQMILPIQNQITNLSGQLTVSLQIQFNTANAARLSAQDAYNNNPLPSNAAALATAMTAYNAVEAIITPISNQINALVAQREALETANPDLFVADTSNEIVMTCITDLVAQYPGQISGLVNGAMTILSQDCDNRSAALIAQRLTLINEEQALFQQYAQIQIEVKVQIYNDQITQITSDYNDLSSQVVTMANSIEAIQDDLLNKIALLQGVIGNWAATQGMAAAQFADPSFISSALAAIVAADGFYDTSTIISNGMMATVVGTLTNANVFYDPLPNSSFPDGLGPSSLMAAGALADMEQMATAQTNYNTVSPPLIAQCTALNAQLTALNQAWVITVAYINSPVYTQVLVAAFASDPMNALLQSDIDGIATPLQQITSLAATYQQTYSLLLDDLDKTILTSMGMTFTDTDALSLADQMGAWFGAQAYLAANLPQYPMLSQAIATINASQAAGTGTAQDGYNLAIAQVCIANITAAQLIYRQLSNNITFQNQLLAATETDAQSTLPPVVSASTGSAPSDCAAALATAGTQIGPAA